MALLFVPGLKAHSHQLNLPILRQHSWICASTLDCEHFPQMKLQTDPTLRGTRKSLTRDVSQSSLLPRTRFPMVMWK